MRRKYAGFTIIELMVVVAIIGILATLTTMNVVGAKQAANYTKIIADIDAISKSAKLYQEETKNWPDSSNLTTLPPMLPPQLQASTYLGTWPTPPCVGYEYVWLNITSESGEPANRQGVLFAKSPFDAPGKGNIRYYYDINNFAGAQIIYNQNNTYSDPPVNETKAYFQVYNLKTSKAATKACKE